MQLHRIEVRDFRKLRHTVVDGLQDGLNVVVGDNEAGKSTLLAALRAVLFERHRVGGEVAQAMLPYGQAVRPEVSLEFYLSGKAWRLRKAFCQRPEAELVGPGERHAGDAVEDRLAELFGFTPPGKGASHPDKHQGAYGLLWVEQGAAHRSLGIGAGRGTIASALETEVGQVLGGERGRALLAAAEQRRNTFWGKNGKPRGAWKALIDEVETLAATKADLEGQFQAYDSKIADLVGKQDALDRHTRDDRLNKAVQELASAKANIAEIGRLEHHLREAESHRKLASTEQEKAMDRQTTRQKLVRKAATAREALAKAHSQADEARSIMAQREATARTTAQRLSAARAVLLDAEEQVKGIESALARQQANEQLLKLQGQLVACEEADRKRQEALALGAIITLTKTIVDEIEELQAQHDKAKARLQAASVRIEFQPEGEQSIRIGDQVLEPGAAVSLTRRTELTLEGFGTLTVSPGGGLGDLVRQAEQAEQTLNERLRAHSVADVAHARAELQRKVDCQREADAQREVSSAIAPKGTEVIRQAISTQKAVLARPFVEVDAAIGDPTPAILQTAQRHTAEVRETVADADTAAQQAEAARVSADRELAMLDERVAGARRDHDTALQELAQARSQTSDDELCEVLKRADHDLHATQEAEAQARSALDAADPELAHLRLGKAAKAEQSIRSDIEKLTRERRDLEVELAALGRDGIGERLSETEGELALKQKQLMAHEQEAEAARLLFDVLSGAQKESKDRWLGPVRKRVGPYLKVLQPDSDIILNEDTLEIEGFVRNGQSERFDALSMGAREQVAVITRLALADILKGSNQPSAVILDDALVNSDEGRLERMHLVLHKAAQDLQILVLTCRERDFLPLGAPIVRIQ